MEAVEAITTRSSPRAVSEPAVSRDDLAKVLGAAVRAPDHGKLRPWRFMLVEGDNRLKFGELMAQCLKRRDPEATDGAMQAERDKAMRAPLIIIVGAATDAQNPKIPEIEQILAAGAATQNIMLALHSLGYGAMWKTGGITYDPWFKEQLGFRATDHLIGFVYAGTTTSSLPQKDVNWQDYMMPFKAA